MSLRVTQMREANHKKYICQHQTWGRFNSGVDYLKKWNWSTYSC